MSDEQIPSLAAKTFAGLSRLHASFRLPPADEAYWAEVRENYLKWNGSMSDDIPSSLAEAMAEIRRLRARVVELEAAQAMVHGTLERATTLGPVIITHNVPPSAPPHDE